MDYTNQSENLTPTLPLFFLDNYSSNPSHELTLKEATSPKDTSFLQVLHPFIIFNFNGSPFASNVLYPFHQPIYYQNSLEKPSSLYFKINHARSNDPLIVTPINMISPNAPTHNAGLAIPKPLNDSFISPNRNTAMVASGPPVATMEATMVASGAPVTTMVKTNAPVATMKATMAASGAPVTTMVETSAPMTTMVETKRNKKKYWPKVQWTEEEDKHLTELVERYGPKKWSKIAGSLNGRTGKQCRERWHNYLKPDIKRDVWSAEEEMVIVRAHAAMGNKWAEMAKLLPGRTENAIKNHWNATKRKYFFGRKNKLEKYPTQSILAEYLRTMTPQSINSGGNLNASSSTDALNTLSNNDNARDADMGAFLSL